MNRDGTVAENRMLAYHVIGCPILRASNASESRGIHNFPREQEGGAPAGGQACPRRSCWSGAKASFRAAERARSRRQERGAVPGAQAPLQSALTPAVVAAAGLGGHRCPHRRALCPAVVVAGAEGHHAPRRPAACLAVVVAAGEVPPWSVELRQLWRGAAAGAAAALPLRLYLKAAEVAWVGAPSVPQHPLPSLQALLMQWSHCFCHTFSTSTRTSGASRHMHTSCVPSRLRELTVSLCSKHSSIPRGLGGGGGGRGGALGAVG